LLESCEVSALVGFAVVNQFGVGVFDPASWQAWDVAWNTVTATGSVSFGPAKVPELFSQ